MSMKSWKVQEAAALIADILLWAVAVAALILVIIWTVLWAL